MSQAPPATSSSTEQSLAPTPPPTYIYKILPAVPPTPLPPTLPLSPLDTADGFIHLSTAAQVPTTASRFFADARALWVLKVPLARFTPLSTDGGEDGESDEKGKGKVVWERAGDANGSVYPHLYGGDLGEGVVDRVLVFERDGEEGWEGVFERDGGLEG